MTRAEKRLLRAAAEHHLAQVRMRVLAEAYDRDRIPRHDEMAEGHARWKASVTELSNASAAYVTELNYPDTLAAILAESDDGS